MSGLSKGQMEVSVRMFDSIFEGDVRGLKEALDAGADPNSALSCDSEGCSTPLHYACASEICGRAGSCEAVASLLLARGARVNELSPGGSSALSLAARSGEAALIGTLLAAGADLDIAKRPNPGGDPPLDPLCQACFWGKKGAVKALLYAGADPNGATHEGASPLALATACEDEDERDAICSALLDAGADPLAVGRDGRTALDRAPNSMVLWRATEAARARQVGGVLWWGGWEWRAGRALCGRQGWG